MNKQNVKVGDSVLIIAGQDKGKIATVKGITKDKERVLLEGKGLKSDIHKAVKARQASDKGGIITQPGTVAISNVMPVCAACGKAVRVRHAEIDGKKVRICPNCNIALETKKAEKKAKKVAKSKSTEVKEGEAVKKKATVRRKSQKAQEVAEAPVANEGGNE